MPSSLVADKLARQADGILPHDLRSLWETQTSEQATAGGLA